MSEHADLTVFLAGIIQGSLPTTVHPQDYRREIAALVCKHLPSATVYDPFEEHPDSLMYDEERGRDVFFDLMDRAGTADVVIAFLPEASMGTAIEMWNSFHSGGVVIAVTPLAQNWVVKFLADQIVPDISSLKAFLEAGGLEDLLARKIGYEP